MFYVSCQNFRQETNKDPERNAESMGVLVDWPGQDAHPKKFVFLLSESQPPACAMATLDAERQERQREELNALYVALTRACHTLAVSGIEPYRAAERSWWQRLNDLARPLAEPFEQAPAPLVAMAPASVAADADTVQSDGGGGELRSVFYMKELPFAHVEPAQAAIKMEATAGATEALADDDSPSARLGKAMHRLLEWGDASDSHALAAAREFRLSPAQGQQAAAMATRILRGEGAWAWNPAVLSWQGNEVELMIAGESRRLDRLVQRRDGSHAGHWWVLDYKSAHAPQEQPELVAQLRQYQSAVQTIYPGEVVKAAFLTPLGAVIEVVQGG